MPPITGISPEILRDRHRLSSQQVNALFGQRVIEESLEDKSVLLAKVGEFIKVTELLRAGRIDFIPLKGPMLSLRLYGDATYRYFHDLDILISPSEVGHVKKILEREGYQQCQRLWPDRVRMQSRLLRYHHDIPFIHPVRQITVEIHWRLRHRQWLDDNLSDSLVKRNLTEVKYAGRSFRVFNNEMELLYLIIHGGMHQWARLTWICDIREFLKTHKINWEQFNTLSDSFMAGRLTELCDNVLNEHFPDEHLLHSSSPLPAYMSLLSRQRIGAEEYPGHYSLKKSLQNLRFSMIAFPGISYKIRSIGNIILNRGIIRKHK